MKSSDGATALPVFQVCDYFANKSEIETETAESFQVFVSPPVAAACSTKCWNGEFKAITGKI